MLTQIMADNIISLMKKLSNIWQQANKQVRINKDRVNTERANKWVSDSHERFNKFYERTSESYQGSFIKEHVENLKKKVV